ncbi:MAG: CRISPR-associated endonuclease Cas2 [Bacteroidota bacterium]|nr:CRISPR-associated endonuclease Cas2 [Bacteroidota bacterium]
MVNKQQIVIAYDIGNNKRRRKIADFLSSYGYRMNYSVFECMLSEIQLSELTTGLEKLMNKLHDSILIYPLFKLSASHRIYLGNTGKPFVPYVDV